MNCSLFSPLPYFLVAILILMVPWNGQIKRQIRQRKEGREIIRPKYNSTWITGTWKFSSWTGFCGGFHIQKQENFKCNWNKPSFKKIQRGEFNLKKSIHCIDPVIQLLQAAWAPWQVPRGSIWMSKSSSFIEFPNKECTSFGTCRSIKHHSPPNLPCMADSWGWWGQIIELNTVIEHESRA